MERGKNPFTYLSRRVIFKINENVFVDNLGNRLLDVLSKKFGVHYVAENLHWKYEIAFNNC